MEAIESGIGARVAWGHGRSTGLLLNAIHTPSPQEAEYVKKLHGTAP